MIQFQFQGAVFLSNVVHFLTLLVCEQMNIGNETITSFQEYITASSNLETMMANAARYVGIEIVNEIILLFFLLSCAYCASLIP